jgi:hypothetical protein
MSLKASRSHRCHRLILVAPLLVGLAPAAAAFGPQNKVYVSPAMKAGAKAPNALVMLLPTASVLVGGTWTILRTEDSAELSQQVAVLLVDAFSEAGWKIAKSDPARGAVEATASVSYIRFHDDVVIRILPVADGSQSRVDMRSVSRVGVGDLGVNAWRIRSFLGALAAA